MGLIFGYYLFFPGRSSVLGHLAGQRLEERDQVRAVLGGKVERLDVLVEIGIGVAASDVEIDHIIAASSGCHHACTAR